MTYKSTMAAACSIAQGTICMGGTHFKLLIYLVQAQLCAYVLCSELTNAENQRIRVLTPHPNLQ